jgi:hypothetical protein
MIELLPSKHETPSSNPSTTKKQETIIVTQNDEKKKKKDITKHGKPGLLVPTRNASTQEAEARVKGQHGETLPRETETDRETEMERMRMRKRQTRGCKLVCDGPRKNLNKIPGN